MEPKMLKIIWALAHKAQLSEDELRDNVEAVSGQRSIRALDGRQLGQLIPRLRKLTGEPEQVFPPRRGHHEYPLKRTKAKEGNQVVRMITLEQRLFIDWLLKERVDIGIKDPQLYLATMCRRIFHHDEPRTAREAGLVIGNLRKQAERQAKSGVIPTFDDFISEGKL